MRKKACLACIACLLSAAALPGPVRGDMALYIGGGIAAIPEKQRGKLNVSDVSVLVFRWDKGEWQIPFKRITRLEYGERAARRVAAGIALSTVGTTGPALLVSKKEKHFLTIQVVDEAGKNQRAAFELSKGTYDEIIATLETKTGLKAEYTPEETQKGKRALK